MRCRCAARSKRSCVFRWCLSPSRRAWPCTTPWFMPALSTDRHSAGERRVAHMLKEFREFAMKGNVVDLAVGVIIGAAFGAIVNSLVGDIIMPLIGAVTGGLAFSNYFIPLSSKITASNLADAKKQGAVLAWGNFLTVTLNFIIIAFVLFLVIRTINQLKRKDEAPPPPPKLTREEELLTEIRALLKKG